MREVLWKPIAIRGVTFPNRILMPSMTLFYTTDRKLDERYARFWERRAEGGVGCIVVGPVGIDLEGSGMMTLGMDSDSVVPEFARLTERLHAHGTRVIAQLFHSGRYAMSMLTGTQPIAPSAVTSDFSKETPRAMTLEDIARTQDSFAAAARRAREAGMDGVEVIASAGYLVSQFLSPVTNLRDDAYGGGLEARTLYAREVVAKVRAAVGPGMVVAVRVAGNDFVAGSHDSAASAKVCQALVESGADLIDVTGGWHETRIPQLTMEVPPGAYAYLARTIREATGGPVVASNRLGDPDVAARILRDGMADLVALGRPLVADPDWPRKVREGRDDEIAPCVACMSGCMDRLMSGRPVTCTINPDAGLEVEAEAARGAAGKPRKRIVVIGGGPAGMQASVEAARLGHEVHLLEASPRLGGQVLLAAAVPGRSDLQRLVRYYEAAIAREGVDLRLGFEADAGKVAGLSPDHVVVATGAAPARPGIPGVGGPRVVDAWDLLGEGLPAGRRVAVVGGGAVGLDVALALAVRGTLDPETLAFLVFHGAEADGRLHELVEKGTSEITVIEMLPKAGADLGRSSRWVVMVELERRGVRIMTSCEVTSIGEDGTVSYGRRLADGSREEASSRFDTVVLALGSVPRDPLSASLEAAGLAVTRVGDCVKPARIIDAIHQGHRAARAL